MDPNVERYRIAVDAAPCGALLVNAEGIILHANTHLAEMFERTTSELVGGGVDELLPPETRARHAGLRASFAASPSVRQMGEGRALVGYAKSGRRFPIEVSLRPVEGEEGPWVLCTVLDISARVREQERFHTALNAAPNAILMVDRDGTIVLCNRHTERVFGHSRDTLVGRTIESLLPPSAAERHRAHREGYTKSPTPRAMGAGRELMAVRADGSQFPVEVALQPVAMDDGDYVIASVIDITVRVEAQRRIEAQHAELQERNREIRALARSASHDLKGPLTTIVGLASSMLEDLESGQLEEVPRVAEWTRRLASRTAASLEKLREIADATLDHHPVSDFDLKDSVQEVVDELEALRTAVGVDIRVHVPEGLSVRTERSRLTSILHNLLGNALQYHDPSKDERWAEVRASEHGTTLRLLVRDNGIGVPDEMRDRVFDLFERVETSPDSGPGIGLALVRRHVRQLGGRVRLEPVDLTTFVVELPLRAQP